MRLISLILTAFLCATVLLPAGAQENAAELAVKLGSRSYTERESATKKLEQLGLLAMPALRVSMSSADLETKRRAVHVMERIEDRALQDEVVKPTAIRLRFSKTPVSAALSEVARQTGLPFGGADRKTHVTLDTGAVPYWRAWREFCKASHLEEDDFLRTAAKLKRLHADDFEQLKPALARGRLDLRPLISLPPIAFAAAHNACAEDVSHSVRVRIQWHSLGAFMEEKQTHAMFAVEVRPEPRLEITTLPRTEITKIVDAEGNARPVQASKLFPETYSLDNQIFLSAYVGEIQYGGLLHLKSIRWQGPMRALREVHGLVRIEVAMRPRMMEVPGVFQAAGKEVRGSDGITLKILEANRQSVRLRVRLDHLDSLTPRTLAEQAVRIRPGVIGLRGPMDIAMERIELHDSRGWKCKVIEASYVQAEDGKGYIADLLFEEPVVATDDLTLVMTKGARQLAVDVPFLVRDVPLPATADKKPARQER